MRIGGCQKLSTSQIMLEVARRGAVRCGAGKGENENVSALIMGCARL
jgi:hypothetical protein